MMVQSGLAQELHPVMRPDRETRQEWYDLYENAPRAYIDPKIELQRGNLSLLSHLQYTPSQYDQGYCGNCWMWAGTSVMAIALDVQEGILDRLSVQYLNSCAATVIGVACCDGGFLSYVDDFYSSTGFAIPWSNSNAYFHDYNANCTTSCGSISTTPNYTITNIYDQTITTHGVGSTTAINNIKNVLNQNKAVNFAYYLPTSADWNNFGNFYYYQSESVTWNPDFSCGHTWENPGGGGHAVLCVGYNDDNPSDRYWIMVNSWGTTSGRPNCIFHVDMDMNYDCEFYDGGWTYDSFLFQTLSVTYDIAGPTSTPTPSAPTFTPSAPTFTPTAGPTSPCDEYDYFIMDNDCVSYTTNFHQLCDGPGYNFAAGTTLCPTACSPTDECHIGWAWESGDSGIHWQHYYTDAITLDCTQDVKFDMCYGMDGYDVNLQGDFYVYWRSADSSVLSDCTGLGDSAPSGDWQLAWSDTGVNWNDACSNRTINGGFINVPCTYDSIQVLIAVNWDAYADQYGIGYFRVYYDTCEAQCSGGQRDCVSFTPTPVPPTYTPTSGPPPTYTPTSGPTPPPIPASHPIGLGILMVLLSIVMAFYGRWGHRKN